ncbi:hypothetical protein Tco_0743736 [Tanacetum coccineum]
MNYIPVSVKNQVNVDADTQDSYVASSSRKDKGPTQEYILLLLQPYRTRIPVEDVPPAAHEKSFEKLAAKAMDDVSRQAFEEEKRRIASQKKAAQATSTNKLSTDRQSVSTDRQSVSTDRPFVSTDRLFVSTDRSNTPYVSAVSTPDRVENASPNSYTRIHIGFILKDNSKEIHISIQTRGKIQKGYSAQQAFCPNDSRSLMYLNASRPDIMFVVCACARFQVTPKALRLNAVKRIFRRLISRQCKKQTIMANSTTEAEYVVAANCYGQVLWIQNQMMDYGFNFMNTKIHIDNKSTISVIKNPVAHSRTKHIEIRFHFIRDCYEKRLIEGIKIHTDSNVAGLLTKGFDVTRFNFLVVSIGMLNL